MSRSSVKLTLQLPEGLAKEINEIVEKHDLWMSSQDFIREAIKDKIEHWKRDHAVG
ncbi:MAG: ribbon-helix-helix domain-containing protein [Thermoplasmataceae archaeon]